MFWALLAVAVLLLAGYRKLSYWSSRGVYQHSVWTECKIIAGSILQSTPSPEAFRQNYNNYSDRRYAGTYLFLRPRLLIRDPDLIEQIALKEFDHFVDRGQVFRTQNEQLWERMLLTLKGKAWRDMRITLLPFFTTNQLKSMFGLIVECAQNFVRHLESSNNTCTTMNLDMKDAFTRYANDVIASTAFGLNCDSLKEPGNEFYLTGREATKFAGPKFVLFLVAPLLVKWLGVRFISKKVEAFFTKIIKDAIEERRSNGVVRPDLIQLMMDAQKDGDVPKPFSDEDFASQAFAFYLAAFDTVSTTMSFVAYELALNPEVQKRLQRDIDQQLLKNQGKITYETIMDLKYLEMVISETLRKWPTTTAVNRTCTKPFTIQPSKADEKIVRLKVGDVIILPYYGIHRDCKHYPDPDRFDPQRFSSENVEGIKPNTYLPFGIGPRGCMGSRLALLEIKVLFFHLLSKFDLVVAERTDVPVKLGRNRFNLSLANGMWLGLEARTQ